MGNVLRERTVISTNVLKKKLKIDNGLSANFFIYRKTRQLLRNHQVPVIQRLDKTIHRINHYPVGKCSENKPHYSLDSDYPPQLSTFRTNRAGRRRRPTLDAFSRIFMHFHAFSPKVTEQPQFWHTSSCRFSPISFPEAAILLVSDGDRDLWPG